MNLDISHWHEQTKRAKKDAKKWKGRYQSLQKSLKHHKSAEVKSCVRKIAYNDRESAQCEAEAMGQSMRAYNCPYCGHWHLTSSVRKR